MRSRRLCLILLVFKAALAVADPASDTIDGDAAIRAVVKAQNGAHSVPVSDGCIPRDALEKYAIENGLCIGEEKNGVRWEIAEAVINGSPSVDGPFFLQREIAFRNAFDAGRSRLASCFPSEKLSSDMLVDVAGVAVIAQAEGMVAGTDKYHVAILIGRSLGLDALWKSICDGKKVRTERSAISIEKWIETNGCVACGPRLFIDENGVPWFVGVTARGVSDPKSKNVVFRKNRGTSELFARQLALRQILGNEYGCAQITSCSKLYGQVVEDPLTGAFRYSAAYGVRCDNIPNIAEILRETGRGSPTQDVVTVAQQGKNDAICSKQEDCAGKGCGSPQCIERVAVDGGSSASAGADVVAEKSSKCSQNEDHVTVRNLKSLCERYKWCVGWDVQNSRIVQIGTSSFACTDPISDNDFYIKRGEAIKGAAAAGLVKIACQLDFSAVTDGAQNIRIPVDGASVLWISEVFEPERSLYTVSAVVTWSKRLESVGRSIAVGEACQVPPGKLSVRDWLEQCTLTGLSGPRVYFDCRGNAWLLSSVAFRFRRDMRPDERGRIMDWANGYLRDMLAFGSHVDILIPRIAYDSFKTRMRDLVSEQEINQLVSGLDIKLRLGGKSVRGERDMLNDEIKMVKFNVTHEDVRVLVFGLNANLVANSSR